jgi:hypothetical protein
MSQGKPHQTSRPGEWPALGPRPELPRINCSYSAMRAPGRPRPAHFRRRQLVSGLMMLVKGAQEHAGRPAGRSCPLGPCPPVRSRRPGLPAYGHIAGHASLRTGPSNGVSAGQPCSVGCGGTGCEALPWARLFGQSSLSPSTARDRLVADTSRLPDSCTSDLGSAVQREHGL